MSFAIGLLCLLAGGAAIWAVKALLRWMTGNNITGDDVGSAWDCFWALLEILTWFF
jgi:hypothetical protein